MDGVRERCAIKATCNIARLIISSYLLQQSEQSQPVTEMAALIELELDGKVDYKISGGNAKVKMTDRVLGMDIKISPRQHEAMPSDHGEHTETPTKCPPSPNHCQLYQDIMSSPPQLSQPTRQVFDTTLFEQIPFPILPHQVGSQGCCSYTFRKRARTICGSSSSTTIISDSGTNKRARLSAQWIDAANFIVTVYINVHAMHV